jgi:hypothetical protein
VLPQGQAAEVPPVYSAKEILMNCMSRARCAFVLATLALLGFSAFADAPLTGSIKTTDSTCTTVNGNVQYVDKSAVYISGENLVPSVSYYVRVTDPSGVIVLGTSVPNKPITTNSSGNFSCLQLIALVGGSYADSPNPAGEYKVFVGLLPDFSGGSRKTDNFRIGSQTPVADTGSIAIRKFYDTNANGVWDAGEMELPDAGAAPYGNTGWKVDLVGSSAQLTPASYTSLQFSTYTAREYAPTQGNWYSTAPTPIDMGSGFLNKSAVTVSSESPYATVIFGNVCTGAGGGKTLGFWSNKNGEAAMTTYVMKTQLLYLSSLNLRNPDGSHFDPGTYAAFRNWLLNGNAVNMQYMLSVQMAAMALNISTGKVTGTSMVYAPGAQTANDSGFISAAALVNEANAALANPTLTIAGVPARAYQGLLKTALDRANNNLTFVQNQPCEYTFAP